MDKLLEQHVRRRAGDACEYCRMHARLYDQPFHIDHIIARKHGGQTVAENLAFSCLDCNAHKGTNIAGLDPLTGKLHRLLNRRVGWPLPVEWARSGGTDAGWPDYRCRFGD